MLNRLRQMANEPVSTRWVDSLVGFALVIWTFGQIVFIHSNISLMDAVVDNGIGQFHQAITVGCLVAALACRGINFKPMGMVALFCALFATLTVWRRANDPHLIVTLLLIVAAKDMDIATLARRYVIGAIAGLLVVCLSVSLGFIKFSVFVGARTYDFAYAFRDASMLPCLLFSVLIGLFLGNEDAKMWRFLAAACVAVTLVELLLGVGFLAVLPLALACGLYVCEVRQDVWKRLMGEPVWRWTVALLPLGLFCVSHDWTKFFGLPAAGGALGSAIGTYGYGACACFAVLYVRSVLLMDSSKRSYLMMLCLAFSVVMLLYMRPSLYLEFNCAYLMLVFGMAGSVPLMPGFVRQSAEQTDRRVRGCDDAEARK